MLTISNKNREIDIPYSGFFRIRKELAKCFSEEFASHYAEMLDGMGLWGEERVRFYAEYDQKTELICNQTIDNTPISQRKNFIALLNFLFLPDCDFEASGDMCRKVWLLVSGKEYTDFICGYPGRENPVKYSDFLHILKECSEEYIPMEGR